MRIRIQGFECDQKLKSAAEKTISFSDKKCNLPGYLPFGPSYRRSLRPTKDKIQHFHTKNFFTIVGSFPDPNVFGPPGSGSISQMYWPGSRSGFYNQANIIRKTLIPTVLWLLLDFLSLKNDVNVPSKSNKQKNFFNSFFAGVLKVNNEKSRIRIQIQIRIH